jgi:hypothetical protein
VVIHNEMSNHEYRFNREQWRPCSRSGPGRAPNPVQLRLLFFLFGLFKAASAARNASFRVGSEY